jgi:hypothetical protein
MLSHWLVTIQEAVNIKWKHVSRSCLNSKNPSSKFLSNYNLGIFFVIYQIYPKTMLNIRSKIHLQGKQVKQMKQNPKEDFNLYCKQGL